MEARINLRLHPKQGAALQSEATEILYGGAAGGGKSHLMRVAGITWAAQIPGLQVYIFRRTEDDLIKNHIEGPKGFRNMLAPWVDAGIVEILASEIRFWNGSKIYLCHCKDEKHRFKYLGAEIHVLLIDEITTFTDVIYRFLRSRVRAVGLQNIPDELAGRFPRILCGSNPGNIGHHWVKTAFVVTCRDGECHHMPESEGGMARQFIPALLQDNPSMEEDDPLYRARLRGLGNDALVRAMELGDWDIVDGAYFDGWRADIVLKPFAIPKHWLRFGSFDWGSARPFSFGWWAVAGEDTIGSTGRIPKGAMIRYREWYGCKVDQDGQVIPNTGLKLNNPSIGKGIMKRTGSEDLAYIAADPSIFKRDGGPSIAEQMGVFMRRADNKRVAEIGHAGGWSQMAGRIKGEDGRPMIYCFNTCADSIRTIPILQHDSSRPEDVDTDMEDHAADDWRYGCMSRPWTISLDDIAPDDPQHDDYGFDEDEVNEWKVA